jgi:hypothetical protein
MNMKNTKRLCMVMKLEKGEKKYFCLKLLVIKSEVDEIHGIYTVHSTSSVS